MAEGTMLRITELKDRPVEDAAGKRIGVLAELILDRSTNMVSHGVLSCDNLHDSEVKLYAIPWSVFCFRGDHEPLLLEIDRERLKEMLAKVTRPN